MGATTPFTDVHPADPAYTAIDQLFARGVISGYATEPPTFGPGDTSQRAQMAALISRAMGWESDSAGNPFTDRCAPDGCVNDALWGFVTALASRDVAKGYSPTTFGPFDAVLKQQVILFIARAKIYRGDWVKQLDDARVYPGSASNVAAHQEIVTYVAYAGAIPDAPAALDTTWPDLYQPATRGWFARALWQTYPEGKGPALLPEPPTNGSRIAIPSYFYPSSESTSAWDRLNASAPAVGVAIINPNSGPGTEINQDYVDQVARTRQAHVLVLGYVSTQYGQRDSGTVGDEIAAYYSWYQVDGIFLDEASTDCANLAYYQALYDAIKEHGPAMKVAINPGTATNECYMGVADIVLTFEDTYANYVANYSAPAWTSNYAAGRFWHLIHTTGTIPEMQQAMALSKVRRAVGFM
ncbi:MAG: spherulation-specific family 4 protein [Chloroflexia bacterium]